MTSQAQASGGGSPFSFHDGRCRCVRAGCGELRGGNPAHIAISTRGAFGLHIGGRTYLGRPGAALIAPANLDYRVSHPGYEGHDYTVITICPESLGGEVFEAFRGLGACEQNYDLSTHRAFLMASRLRRGRWADAVAVGEAHLAIVSSILRIPPAVGGPRNAPDRCAEVRAAEVEISSRFDQNLSLASLARIAGCSTFHLSRRFRAETGYSIAQYRLRLRLCHALERLIDGEEGLAGLALDLGFCHHSHFTAACTRELGAPPSVIQRRSKAELARLREVIRPRIDPSQRPPT